ncbi:MAG: hypothetical protein H0U57_03405 [Tatlockia sp.]|nr:hypothetical protein [Tatlockia sp.]
MLRLAQIQEIIEECREIGSSGLDNGVNALIPTLEIDLIEPPCDFLGAVGNPAIFVNEQTYKLLGWQHENWIANRTIACKTIFLTFNTIEVIGGIVHETGHAFNVAANIENSEANAYIFEIDVLLKLHKQGCLKMFGCTDAEVENYFKSRLAFYHIDTRDNSYLASLVKTIEEKNQKKSTLFTGKSLSFFDSSWSKEIIKMDGLFLAPNS